MLDDEKQSLLKILLVALLGGAAHQSYQRLGGKRIKLVDFGLRAVISIFIGLLFCFAPHDNPWIFVACGLCSWLGANGVSVLVKLFFRGD